MSEAPEQMHHCIAAFRLHLRAAFEDVELEQVEDPYLCEDGATYQMRGFAADGRVYSLNYVL